MASFSFSVLLMLGFVFGEVHTVTPPTASAASGEESPAPVLLPQCSGSVLLFRAASMVVQPTDEGASELQIIYDKATKIVDEDGQPLPLATVKLGTSVTVQYLSDNGRCMAAVVVIHKDRRSLRLAQE